MDGINKPSGNGGLCKEDWKPVSLRLHDSGS